MGRKSGRKNNGNDMSPIHQNAACISETEVLNHAHQKMLEWLKKVKFKKTLFGGVSERDVWKKISELNELYEASILAERVRYDTLLNAQTSREEG